MAGNIHHVFVDDFVNEARTRRKARDRKHVGHLKDFTLDFLAVLSIILELSGKVLSGEALKVGKSVVKRDGESGKNEFACELLLLFDGEPNITLDGFNQVEQSIGMEHVVLALKEDLAHVLEVAQEVSLLGLLSVEVLHQFEDSLGGLEGILPDFHVQSVLKLLGSKF